MPLPTTYPSEMHTYRDALTGRKVCQLTKSPDIRHVHLYFTENAFTRGRPEIFFQSDRDTPGTHNVFRMNLLTGEMTRVTSALAPSQIRCVTKDPESTRLLFWQDNAVMLLDLRTGADQRLYTLPEGYTPGRLSLSADRQTVAILVNEDVRVEHGINYAGFAEQMYRVKRSMILTVPADGSERARVLLRDTAHGGHLQFSPTDPGLLMFCHEGPWHLVQQRIYLLDAFTGELWPCFRQGPEDSVGHEFFTQDGLIFFDNRGPGHDGTITSGRTQAVLREAVDTFGFVPYVGLADREGKVLRQFPMPFYLNHYHADSAHTRLVGDGIDDLFLIDLLEETPRLIPLCRHATSWHGQHTHCHPTFSYDDRHILFASDRGTGQPQLFLLDMRE